jgi:hypothetical protein
LGVGEISIVGGKTADERIVGGNIFAAFETSLVAVKDNFEDALVGASNLIDFMQGLSNDETFKDSCLRDGVGYMLIIDECKIVAVENIFAVSEKNLVNIHEYFLEDLVGGSCSVGDFIDSFSC